MYLPKIRVVRQLLLELGWRPVRQRGSHQTWKSTLGQTIVLTVNHPSREVAPLVWRKLQSLLGSGSS